RMPRMVELFEIRKSLTSTAQSPHEWLVASCAKTKHVPEGFPNPDVFLWDPDDHEPQGHRFCTGPNKDKFLAGKRFLVQTHHLTLPDIRVAYRLVGTNFSEQIDSERRFPDRLCGLPTHGLVPPSNLHVVPFENGLSVRWQHQNDVPSGQVDSFYVMINRGLKTMNVPNVHNGSYKVYITDLDPCSRYVVTILSCSYTGDCSSGQDVHAQTLPSVPGNVVDLKVDNLPDQLAQRLTWLPAKNIPAICIQTYAIRYGVDGREWHIRFSESSLDQIFSNLRPNTTYFYSVQVTLLHTISVCDENLVDLEWAGYTVIAFEEKDKAVVIEFSTHISITKRTARRNKQNDLNSRNDVSRLTSGIGLNLIGVTPVEREILHIENCDHELAIR
ncbi:protein tyrosine phosphatase receptor, partial [Clonorchis sinensis]